MSKTLKANNILAFTHLILPFLIFGSSLGLFWLGSWYYFAGVFCLSVFLTQCFILLHECGHLNYFKSRWLNVVFGHIFGLLSGLPFYTWQNMHHLHHRWTGWRDKDPTTENTVKPSESKSKNLIINIAWKLFLPIFFLSYHISNYWFLSKIKRFLPTQKFRKSVVHVLAYISVYVCSSVVFWDWFSLYVLPAFGLSLLWKELLIMTQHSHIEIPVSDGKDVKPVAYKDQIQYTRSFYTSSFFARFFLLNFNLHEAHHAQPGVPAYLLHKLDLDLKPEPSYTTWLKKAKSLSGVDYVFKTSKDSGKVF